jgi:transcriptional regulator with XRE-family HTH domain
MSETDNPHAILSMNMRRFRAEKKWSQERLADEAGLHRTYIGSVERLERNPSLASIARIAKALDVGPWQLLYPPEEKN